MANDEFSERIPVPITEADQRGLNELYVQLECGDNNQRAEVLELLHLVQIKSGRDITAQAMPKFLAILQNPEDPILCQAVFFLIAWGARAFGTEGMKEALVAATQNADPDVVFHAVNILTYCPDDDVTKLLGQIAKIGPNKHTQEKAFHSYMLRIMPPDAPPSSGRSSEPAGP